MSTSMTRANGSWLGFGSSKPTERRKARARRGALRRLELLEDRTLLSTIEINNLGELIYDNSSNSVAEHLTVSMIGTAYVFHSSTENIFVTTNNYFPPVDVIGSGTQTVTLDSSTSGPLTSAALDFHQDGDGFSLGSFNAPATVTMNAPNMVGNIGPNLASLTEPITIHGPGSGIPATLNISDVLGAPISSHTLTATTFSASGGFGGLTYSGLTDLHVSTNDGGDVTHVTSLPAGANVTLYQGTGDDLAIVSIPGTAGAASTTLIGSIGNDHLVLNAEGLDITLANFFAGPGDSTTVWGAPMSGQPIVYTNYERVTVTNAQAAMPTVTALPINAVQGTRLVDAIVGEFTSSANWADASDFTATIHWGDGTSSAGVIVEDAATPLRFYVLGTHTYYENAPSLPTSVSVTSMASSVTQFVNGVPVTIETPSSGLVTADGTAVVANAPINVTVSSFSGFENLPAIPSNVFVATFTDLGGVNPLLPNPVSRYTATINWGDGSGTMVVPTSAITQNANTNSYNITLPEHVYTTPGTYIVTVTVSDGGLLGAQNPVTATATGVAKIADAPLTAASPQPAIADATQGVLFTNRILASFTDANPLAQTSEYAVTIDWGDGSPRSTGWVTQPGGTGAPFFVMGSHTYADALRSTSLPSGGAPVAGPVTASGTYPIRIFVQDTYGSAVNLVNEIKVLDQPLTISGQLDAASDSGISNSDAITNVVQPTFHGVASEAGALVFLYATPISGGVAAPIGQATADATGAWSITSSVALADGGYEIQAQAFDASGNTVSALTTITPTLVIDTVGPKINDVYLDNFTGRVNYTIEDLGGVANAGVGVVLASLQDANNYRFSMIYSPVKGYRGAPQWLVTSVDVQPGTNAGEQAVSVLLNEGRPFRGGHYSFGILSADALNKSGVRDVAGNALDGEFYSYFPSGNNVRGGDFLTRLDAVHNINYAPKTYVGPATPVTPPGRPGQTVIVGRPTPRPRPMAPLVAARPRLTAAMAARPRLAALRGR